MTDDEKYSIKDMLRGKLCSECNSPVILSWTSKGKSFECTKCGRQQSEYLYPPPKPPTPGHMRGRCIAHSRLSCAECIEKDRKSKNESKDEDEE